MVYHLKDIICGISYIVLKALREASAWIEKNSKQKKKKVQEYLTPCIVEV